MGKKLFMHMAIVTFGEVGEATKKGATELLQDLGTACGGKFAGILHWQVEQNLDQRKPSIVVVGLFEDEEAFKYFRLHPAHIAAGQLMRDIADWRIADVMVPFLL